MNNLNEKIEVLKTECNEFEEKISNKINDLINNELDYVKGSNLSHIADRLKLFINELNKFEL